MCATITIVESQLRTARLYMRWQINKQKFLGLHGLKKYYIKYKPGTKTINFTAQWKLNHSTSRMIAKYPTSHNVGEER